MPVRITEIPNLAGTQLNRAPVDPRAAAGPGRALGSVAQGIADVGESFREIAEDAQQKENAATLFTTTSSWRRGWADAEADIENDPDPASRRKKRDDFLNALRTDLDAGEIPPDLRHQLLGQLTDFSDRIYGQSEAGIAALTHNRAKLAYQDALDLAQTPRELQQAHATAVAAGVDLPESLPHLERKLAEKNRRAAIEREKIEDPQGFLERMGDKPPENADPVEWQNDRAEALRLHNAGSAAAADEVLDLIYTGKVTTPEEIEQLTPEMRPAARERLKATLAERATQTQRLRILHPQYQNDIVGRIRNGISTYTPDTENEDSTYVSLASLLRQVQDPDLAKELRRQLDHKRSTGFEAVETTADLARQKLKNLHDAKAFGSGNRQTSIFAILGDGILQDPAKLQAEGFSPEQAALITADGVDLDADELKKLGIPATAAGPGLQARIVRFRALSKLRAGEQKSTDFDAAAYDAIRTGKKGFVEFPDKDLQRQRDTAYGAAVKSLETWLRVNPTADDTAINAKLDEITNGRASTEFSEALIGPPPLDIPDDENPLLPPLPEDN